MSEGPNRTLHTAGSRQGDRTADSDPSAAAATRVVAGPHGAARLPGRPWQRAWSSTPMRFLAVGVMNTAFSYAVYAAGLSVGLDFKTANFVSLVVGIVFSFRTQGSLVFRDTTWSAFARYVVAWSVIYLVSIAAIGAFVRLGANAYVAGLLALPVSVAASYLIQRRLVFRGRG